MKILGKLAAAAVLALATASGAATALPTPAVAATASPPWYMDVTYFSGGVIVGSARYYCDGRIRYDGDTWNYDSEFWNYWYECP